MPKKKETTTNKPVESMGRGVTAKMFANVTDEGKKYDKVQIVRTYYDGEEFRSTPTFSVDELPIVAMYALRMYELGIQRRIERGQDDNDDE